MSNILPSKHLSIIIPSKTDKNLGKCVEAIRDMHESGRIIVVDDFEGQKRFLHPDFEPIDWQDGKKPFVFARNINIGIRAAGEDDVILLNDDALLRSPGGFSQMQTITNISQEFGLISATTNVVGNLEQQPQGRGLREEKRTVAFVCVLIPRRTIELVGLLDEAFVAYGWEDNDYCRRVRHAGLKLGIWDGCFVDHGALTSTFRGNPQAPGDIAQGSEIYRTKWGDLN